ncbi:MAG: ester cyclase [Verrucomicrobia bacterium]|nr:ester cyclase [Verrucomicrobiota bacterium]
MNKEIIQVFIDSLWQRRDLDALSKFWRADCVNHALRPSQQGLESLRAYHEEQFKQLEGLSNIRIELVQQIEEEDRVVTHFVISGEQTGFFSSLPPTGKTILLPVIRIDRLQEGKIAEHWSVADLAGVFWQVQHGEGIYNTRSSG